MAIDTRGYSEYLEQHGRSARSSEGARCGGEPVSIPSARTKADLVELKSENYARSRHRRAAERHPLRADQADVTNREEEFARHVCCFAKTNADLAVRARRPARTRASSL
jgi:hypothetical protein